MTKIMTADELFENAALNWRSAHGAGTALVPAPINDKILIYKILTKVYNKNPKLLTVIIVEKLEERANTIEFLTKQENENDSEFKKLIDDKLIRVFTKHFVITSRWNIAAGLCILYHPEDYDYGIHAYFSRCHYRLVVIQKLMSNDNNKYNLFKDNPILECFKQTEIDELRVSSPIEEIFVDVTIPEDSEDWKLYKYYCKYIETSLNVFGSFDILKQARVGNEQLNISSAAICSRIAEENGWNEHLDMRYEFNQSLDELYNPNNLKDRASKTYEMIRNRGILLSDYDKKLEKILEIIKTCAGDKILIISKRGEFASKVTDYINEHSETDICGNYHNKVDDIPAVDLYGNPIFIKSGIERGKRKSMGYKAQMTLNEKKFNANLIQCLSLSNAPDKSLSVDFNTIIITSPQCDNIKSYLYRLSNIRLKGDKIKLFSIFCKNTIEQERLLVKPEMETKIIVNKDKFIENNSDFVIAD